MEEGKRAGKRKGRKEGKEEGRREKARKSKRSKGEREGMRDEIKQLSFLMISKKILTLVPIFIHNIKIYEFIVNHTLMTSERMSFISTHQMNVSFTFCCLIILHLLHPSKPIRVDCAV